MSTEKILVESKIEAIIEKVWEFYTSPSHIVNWNFADPSWHCPSASNDLKVGGKYVARMEAKDGSFGFDFEAIYSEVIPFHSFSYEFGGREAKVDFYQEGNLTSVKITFDPETENPVELQQAGWQAILNNFKNYVENN